MNSENQLLLSSFPEIAKHDPSTILAIEEGNGGLHSDERTYVKEQQEGLRLNLKRVLE